jgi:hypothetical protein
LKKWLIFGFAIVLFFILLIEKKSETREELFESKIVTKKSIEYPNFIEKKKIFEQNKKVEAVKKPLQILKEKSENRRLQIEKFNYIKNTIVSKHKSIELKKHLILNKKVREKYISKGSFAKRHSPQKKYIFLRKQQEAKKNILVQVKGEFNEN